MYDAVGGKGEIDRQIDRTFITILGLCLSPLPPSLSIVTFVCDTSSKNKQIKERRYKEQREKENLQKI